MTKEHSLGYGGMNQDTAKSKTENSTYFSALNIKLLSTTEQATFALSNSAGNELLYTIPTVTIDSIKTRFSYTKMDADGTTAGIMQYQRKDGYSQVEDLYLDGGTIAVSGSQKIIGTVDTRGGAVIVTTDNNGWDCFWELTGVDNNDVKLNLIYVNNLGFNTDSPLRLIYNYENSLVEKIYFVDGKRQLSHFNMRQSIENGDLINLADTRSEIISAVSEFTFNSPKINSVIGGGGHTAGMIQYAYNLYVLNGSQTTISPLSELVPLDRGEGLGGGTINEALGRAVNIEINNIDQDFTHIKIYAIKYTSFNEIPSISLIAEREIDGETINYYDGGSIKDSLSLEEFLFLGSAPYIPAHIESKDSRLFMFNIKEKYFNVDLDARCYGHDTNGDSKIWENVSLGATGQGGVPVYANLTGAELVVNTSTYSVPLKHDSVNKNYEVYKYTLDGQTYGAEGKYFILKINQTTNLPEGTKTLKDNDIYRFGIEFYNKLGQKSEPIWMTDLRAPQGNLTGQLSTIEFEVKPAFFTWLDSTVFEEDQKPVGYRLLRANRTDGDKLIATQGMINPMVANYKSTSHSNTSNHYGQEYYGNSDVSKVPSMVRVFGYGDSDVDKIAMRACDDGLSLTYNPGNFAFDPDGRIGYTRGRFYPVEVLRSKSSDDTRSANFQFNKLMQVTSPESLFSTVDVDGSYELKVVGVAAQKYLKSWGAETDARTTENTVEAVIDGNFTHHNPGIEDFVVDEVVGNAGSLWDFGFLGPSNSDSNNTRNQVLRDFTAGFTYSSLTTVGIQQLWRIAITGGPATTGGNFTLTVGGNSYESAQVGRNWTKVEIAEALDSSWSNIPGYTCQRAQNYLWLAAVEAGPQTDIVVVQNNVQGITMTHSIEMTGSNAGSDNPASTFQIYGAPETTERGANFSNYNNDAELRYGNTMQTMQMDGFNEWDVVNDDGGRTLWGVNSFGSKCITLAEGSDDSSTPLDQRKSIEEIFNLSMGDNPNLKQGILIVELIKNITYAYVGSLYGGNTYEDKSSADYISVGAYKGLDANDTTLIALEPGDTYVNDFKFTRLSKTEDDNSSEHYTELTEIVNFRVESSIDLSNRSDISRGDWSSKYFPDYEEFQDYNRVYSQQPTLIVNSDLGFKFKAVKQFDTKIISSKQKISGEYIDSWTDFLENETMELDGKYGSINATTNFNDEIFAWQDNSFAKININPRVQISGNDGAALELGTGGVLYDYSYLTTLAGTLNDSSIVKSTSSIYFFDINNVSIFKYSRDGVTNLTDAGGMHTYMNNYVDISSLSKANVYLGDGISCGYDMTNNDVYFTFLQSNFTDPNPIGATGRRAETGKNFTLAYNEAIGKFTSFYSFTPSTYLTGALAMVTSGTTNSDLWIHKNTSPKGNYYTKVYPSTIDFNINPMGSKNKVYTNLSYKMEARTDGLEDLPNKTFDQVLLWNDYQQSIPTALVLRKNIRRKDRTWNVTLPREAYTRNRIRSPWARMRLLLNNSEDMNIVAHDLIVSYTEH